MGIDNDGAAFLQAIRRVGVDFGRTCTIGRQRLTTDGSAVDGSEAADDFFSSILATRTLDALDYSDYEGATIVHDLNSAEAPSGKVEAFTAVVDGGSLEHIFHVPNALSTMMSMVAPRGHIVFISPCDGLAGHGLYQFSPELFFRSLSEENGFAITLCLLKELGLRGSWYEVVDPKSSGRRMDVRMRAGGYLYVVAQRVDATRPLFREMPQQSDYSSVWTENSTAVEPRSVKLARKLPHPAQRVARAGREFVRRTLGPRASGLRRIDIDEVGAP